METIVVIIIVLFFISYVWEKIPNKPTKRITYTNSEGQTKTENLKRRQPRTILELEMPEIEHTEEIDQVLEALENSKENIFLTGKAGTGKSTLLKYFRTTTNKNYAVVAPTGIAAVNVQGQTIHSFFGFGIDVTPERVKYAAAERLNTMRKLETLIIDEISMVRADLLDCIDESLRKNRCNNLPFGGVQVVAVGDPYQLPPVVKTPEYKYFKTVYKSPHFFSANSYKKGNFLCFELTKIFRQKDDLDFIDILNSIRSGNATQEYIDRLNFNTKDNLESNRAIKLVTTNDIARSINNSELRNLPGESKIYKGLIIDDFKEESTPTDIELMLKEGARVLLLNNDRRRRWVNGDKGTVIGLYEGSIRVKFDEDDTYEDVDLNEWDNIKFVFDEEKGKIEPYIVGKFIQLPVKLAWAITIHKSQGMTYDNVHIDFGVGTFAAGQAYVALSRCKSLAGLTLEAPMVIDDIIVDEDVKNFMKSKTNEENIETINTIELTKRQSSKDKTISSNVSPSQLNKLKYFVEYPERYALNTAKCIEKVKDAEHTFEILKESLDVEFVEKYFDALEKYKNKLNSVK